MIEPPINRIGIPEAQLVTNVFVDLTGSTEFGEKLQDNQYYFGLLDRWQRLTSYLVCSYGGLIGGSNSDMVMGYFRGLETVTLASSRAILAAKRIREHSIGFWQEYHTPLDVHIGIHSGNVEVGVIGPEIRSNLTTIGPPVNIAARIEGKAVKGEIRLSEKIKNEVKICWSGEFVKEEPMKGVEQPIKMFRVHSVGFDTIPAKPLDLSEWIFATLEAQALQQAGRDADAFKLAEKAALSSQAAVDLSSDLILLPFEVCIGTLLSLNKPTKAQRFIREYAKRAERLSVPIARAHADSYLAESLMVKEKYGEAISAYSNAKRGYETYDRRRKIADCLFYSGICFQHLGDSEQAAGLFEQAKENYQYFIHNQKSEDVEVGQACLELSVLLVDDPWKVIEVLTLAIKKFKDTCQFRFLLRALINMVYVCNHAGRPTDAENYARRALDLAVDFDPVNGTIDAFQCIGNSIETKCILGFIKRTDVIRDTLNEAKFNYQQALDLARSINLEDRCQKLSLSIHRIDERLEQLDRRS